MPIAMALKIFAITKFESGNKDDDNDEVVINNKTKSLLINLKDIMKSKSDTLNFNLIKNLIIIYLNIYQKIWLTSGNLNVILSFIFPINSIFQSIIFATVSNFLLFCWNLPLQFYNTYVISKFPNKNDPLTWFLTNFFTMILNSISNSIKIYGFLKLVSIVQNFPIWQLCFGYFIFSILRISIVPLVLRTIFPGFMKPVPEGELKDELSKLCKQVGYNLNHIYLDNNSEPSFLGFDYLPNLIIISNKLINQLSPKEVSAIVLQLINLIKSNVNLKKFLPISIILYANIYSFDKLLMNDDTILNQFGFSTSNQDNDLLFIKYLLFMKLFIPFEIIIDLSFNYFQRLTIYKIDLKTYKFNNNLLNALENLQKNNGNNSYEIYKYFKSDSLYDLYRVEIPSYHDRIENLKSIDQNNTE
ncbi:uncharacterized protein KGF55_001319 [Candida pseudojiufengensis]|uniref:uncharacterized protein n=1 Tax=Candida pseudojiufengensis TaxID=497109 RepID=UPI002223F943|nr:uncharacterized protein KGF55_001319 [Candida pseudojiufengensis]KAI5965955.1 hypothetical protein KGF55_001319 [Candida pseudojiufengensis]